MTVNCHLGKPIQLIPSMDLFRCSNVLEPQRNLDRRHFLRLRVDVRKPAKHIQLSDLYRTNANDLVTIRIYQIYGYIVTINDLAKSVASPFRLRSTYLRSRSEDSGKARSSRPSRPWRKSQAGRSQRFAGISSIYPPVSPTNLGIRQSSHLTGVDKCPN